MDPVSIGLISVALIFSAVCFFIIKMAPKEKSFEEAYGKNAIKLLSDDSSKQKPKPKGKKNKEKKETTGDEKKADDSKAKDEKVNQNFEDKSKDIESAESKSNKKKANKKFETEHKKEVEVEGEEVVQLKTVFAQKSSPPKPKAKKSGPLNFDRLLVRLSEVELESEILDFVRRLNEQAQNGEKKQKEELKLKREVNEKEREIDRLHDLLESSQTNMAKIKSLEQALAEAKEKYQVLESSMKPKVNEHRQLMEKVNLLQKQVADASTRLGAAERLEKENEKLKSNVDLLSQALASANNKIYISESNVKQVEAALKKITEAPQRSSDVDRLSAKLDEFAKMENIQRETIGNLQRDVGSLQAEIERRNESVNQLSNERSLLLTQLNEIRDKSGLELDQLRNDLSKWQKNYKALEEQFTKIRDAESLAKTLKEELEIVRENEKKILTEKSKVEENVIGLQKRLRQLESEVEAAKNQIDSEDSNRDQYKNQIEEFENIKAEFNQKVKKMAEDLTLYETVNKDLLSERERLQYQISQVNSSSDASEKLRKLEEELEYQKQRSQELRDRNYKLHELVKESEENVRKVLSSQGPVKVEKKSDNEVEDVISSVAKSVGLKPPASFTATSIQEWFKKALNDGKAHSEHKLTQNGTKNDKIAEDLLQQIDRLNGEAEQYKMAINVAYEQLDHAAKLADDLQQKYESQLNEIHRK